MTDFSWLVSLRCPTCRHELRQSAGSLICKVCQQSYPRRHGSIIFRVAGANRLLGKDFVGRHPDNLLLRLKALAKQSPRFFSFLALWSAAFIGRTARRAIKSVPAQSLVLNLGAGARHVRPGVVNVDYEPFAGIDVVADIYRLPFADSSAAAVIAESVLEHLADPAAAIAEIKRVLRPGGLLYVVTPFMLGYHASPRDYYRWTEFGMKELLTGFTIKESGSAWGPTVAAASVVGSWLSLVLSLGWSPLYQLWSVFFLFLFGPFTYFDYLLGRHGRAKDTAHGLYFIAEKR